MNQTPEQTTETAKGNEQNMSIKWKNFSKEIGEIIESNLEEGVEIITKVIKPQVNYKEKMIQTAQIEVSVG